MPTEGRMCQLRPSTWKEQIPESYKVLHKVMAAFTVSHHIPMHYSCHSIFLIMTNITMNSVAGQWLPIHAALTFSGLLLFLKFHDIMTLRTMFLCPAISYKFSKIYFFFNSIHFGYSEHSVLSSHGECSHAFPSAYMGTVNFSILPILLAFSTIRSTPPQISS